MNTASSSDLELGGGQAQAGPGEGAGPWEGRGLGSGRGCDRWWAGLGPRGGANAGRLRGPVLRKAPGTRSAGLSEEAPAGAGRAPQRAAESGTPLLGTGGHAWPSLPSDSGSRARASKLRGPDLWLGSVWATFGSSAYHSLFDPVAARLPFSTLREAPSSQPSPPAAGRGRVGWGWGRQPGPLRAPPWAAWCPAGVATRSQPRAPEGPQLLPPPHIQRL